MMRLGKFIMNARQAERRLEGAMVNGQFKYSLFANKPVLISNSFFIIRVIKQSTA